MASQLVAMHSLLISTICWAVLNFDLSPRCVQWLGQWWRIGRSSILWSAAVFSLKKREDAAVANDTDAIFLQALSSSSSSPSFCFCFFSVLRFLTRLLLFYCPALHCTVLQPPFNPWLWRTSRITFQRPRSERVLKLAICCLGLVCTPRVVEITLPFPLFSATKGGSKNRPLPHWRARLCSVLCVWVIITDLCDVIFNFPLLHFFSTLRRIYTIWRGEAKNGTVTSERKTAAATQEKFNSLAEQLHYSTPQFLLLSSVINSTRLQWWCIVNDLFATFSLGNYNLQFGRDEGWEQSIHPESWTRFGRKWVHLLLCLFAGCCCCCSRLFPENWLKQQNWKGPPTSTSTFNISFISRSSMHGQM